jgi:hypothetical protein
LARRLVAVADVDARTDLELREWYGPVTQVRRLRHRESC